MEHRAEPLSAAPAYAGIGAHDTPGEVLELMRAAAGVLARAGWRLRSGMSPGADIAFYSGALDAGGAIELYLPWPGFGAGARRALEERSARVREISSPGAAAEELAARFCPDWQALDQRRRALIARDGQQVLGADLREPVELVLCWTPDGDLDGRGARAGGTGQALRIARARGIEVLNLQRPEHAAGLRERLARARAQSPSDGAGPALELPAPGPE